MAALLTILGLSLALWGEWQYVCSHFDYLQAGASFHQHNGLAAFLSLCLPSALSGLRHNVFRKRVFYSVGCLVILIGLLCASSRGATAALLLSFLSLFIWVELGASEKTAPTWASALLLVVTFSVMLVFAMKTTHGWSANGRQTYTETGLNILSKNPFLGIGPGNYDSQIKNYLSGPELKRYNDELLSKQRVDFWISLHNIYLQMAVEYGLIGFLIWISALAWMLYPLIFIRAGRGFSLWAPPYCFLISILAFLLHNTVDILFVNSFDLLFVIQLALCRNSIALRDRT